VYSWRHLGRLTLQVLVFSSGEKHGRHSRHERQGDGHGVAGSRLGSRRRPSGASSPVEADLGRRDVEVKVVPVWFPLHNGGFEL
jgi:hypothetical protein